VYDQIILPAMSLAEHDWHQGRMDERKQSLIRQAVRDLVEEVGEKPRKIADVEDEPAKGGTDGAPTAPPAPSAEETHYDRCVLCIPARDPADEIAAMMLAQVLEHDGYCAEYVSVEKLASEYIELVEKNGVQVVFVSALPPAAVTHARYIAKRLRARFPDLKIIVGLWAAEGDIERARQRLASAGTDLVVGSMDDAREKLRQTVQPLLVAAQSEPAVSAK
jgi:methylmalonyl-CoA mutase cobalamin-binding subunit